MDKLVELIDCMGSDLTVVNAARVSFHKESKMEFSHHGMHLTSADQKLVKYLAEHNHWTPFSHPQLQFRIKMPLFITREWYRHTVGLTRNEVSRRYVSDEPDFWEPKEFRLKHESKKQGSSDDTLDGYDSDRALGYVRDAADQALESYNNLLHLGVAPEIARTVLPVSMYTEFIETGSLYAYARICKLRNQPDAQKEIQEYARAIDSIISTRFPTSWHYLTQHTRASSSEEQSP